jgi:hypothetical protein
MAFMMHKVGETGEVTALLCEDFGCFVHHKGRQKRNFIS